eukprot:5960527-Amphidinium_carterae.2
MLHREVNGARFDLGDEVAQRLFRPPQGAGDDSGMPPSPGLAQNTVTCIFHRTWAGGFHCH